MYGEKIRPKQSSLGEEKEREKKKRREETNRNIYIFLFFFFYSINFYLCEEYEKKKKTLNINKSKEFHWLVDRKKAKRSEGKILPTPPFSPGAYEINCTV